MKKTITIILFFIITGCGFKVVKMNDVFNFSIVEFETTGDKKINYIIKNNFLISIKQNEEKQISININTNKEKSIKEKNIKNEITKYVISIVADVNLKEISKAGSFKFTIIQTGTFSVAGNNSDTRNNEKNLISLLSNKLAKEILREVKLKLNDI